MWKQGSGFPWKGSHEWPQQPTDLYEEPSAYDEGVKKERVTVNAYAEKDFWDIYHLFTRNQVTLFHSYSCKTCVTPEWEFTRLINCQCFLYRCCLVQHNRRDKNGRCRARPRVNNEDKLVAFGFWYGF